MGRELQKKKNRSSIPKVRHKPKSKKLNIKGNPIVAANWFASPLSFPLPTTYVITHNQPSGAGTPPKLSRRTTPA